MNETKPRTVYLLKRTDKTDDGTEIYVGSTSMDLKERLWSHKSVALKLRNRANKLYKKMREVGLNNWEIVPLLSYTCDRKTIREFERGWYNALNADLNTNVPFSGFDNKKEYDANYRKLNKEAIKQRDADYYKLNKETIKQKKAECRKSNKQNKVYHCNVREKSFESNWLLKRHLDTLKHQYAYLNSLD